MQAPLAPEQAAEAAEVLEAGTDPQRIAAAAPPVQDVPGLVHHNQQIAAALLRTLLPLPEVRRKFYKPHRPAPLPCSRARAVFANRAHLHRRSVACHAGPSASVHRGHTRTRDHVAYRAALSSTRAAWSGLQDPCLQGGDLVSMQLCELRVMMRAGTYPRAASYWTQAAG